MTKTQYAKYLQSDHWRAKRLEAIEGANSKCERCELPRWLAEIAYDQDLHVHHKSYANLGDEDWDDLEVLCRRCHDLETFGRSELRAPKRVFCEMCSQMHWDPRSNLCIVCSEMTGRGELPLFFRLRDREPGLETPLWHRIIREMVFALGTDNLAPRQEVLEVLTIAQRNHKAAMAQGDIPF